MQGVLLEMEDENRRDRQMHLELLLKEQVCVVGTAL